MTDVGLLVPTRNLLTGSVVNWSEEEVHPDPDKMEGLSLTWKDLSVYRKRRIQHSIWRSPTYENVKVLHGVNGIATQGNLIAIMGSSGAGKTSLLAAISRRDKSSMTGSLQLNGRPANARVLAQISGFVPQHDLSVVDLHVREHMVFMARLMMDRRFNAAARSRRIQELLTELNVASCIHTKLRALSGGERKRISLAVQLLNDPPVLFCDEPTTGLDSWAASAVISRLRRLSTAGKMVICSIHQPASGVFEMFDQVTFLAGGRVAFQGTIEQAADFFSGLGFKCPIGFNQAEYYVSRLGVEVGRELESHERVQRICNEFRRSKMATEIERRLIRERDRSKYPGANCSTIFDTGGESDSNSFERYLTMKKVGYFTQFCWLLWRNVITLRRNYTIWIAEFIIFMGVGLMLAIPYAGVTNELDQRDIQNVEGLLYLSVAETIFMFIYAVFITFPHEVPVLLRETANGLYSQGPYYLSKMTFWLPRAIISPVLYATLIYCVVGLQGGFTGWFWFNFICVLSANTANAYGSFLSATFESMETAALISVPVDLLGLLFSGIFLNLASLPVLVSWLKYISPFYYGIEAISIMQWDSISGIKCVDVPGMPCIKTGAEVLARYGYKQENFWIDVGGLCIMYCCYNLVAYVMVHRRSRRAPVY